MVLLDEDERRSSFHNDAFFCVRYVEKDVRRNEEAQLRHSNQLLGAGHWIQAVYLNLFYLKLRQQLYSGRLVLFSRC